LAFTEAWERFSFYGMQALLVLYMTSHLLVEKNRDAVAGLASFQGGLESIFGPMSTPALASQIFGLYTGFVYFTPALGGLIGDRVLGQKVTVMLGALVMAGGHFLMVWEGTFLLALLLLIIGCGLLKGNIAAQVSQLYKADDQRRTGAFSIFLIGMNTGALAAPLVCGTLGEIYGWHYGFGAAGIGMLIGLLIYASGWRHLPSVGPRAPRAVDPQVLGHTSGRRKYPVLGLLVIVLVYAIFVAAYGQAFNMFVLWARDYTDRSVGSFEMPVSWFFTADALFTICFTAVLVKYWRRQSARGTEINNILKIIIGCGFSVAAFLVLALAAHLADGGAKVSMLWPIIFFILVDFGAVMLWPASIAAIATGAPQKYTGLMIGVFYMGPFAGNLLVGLFGQLYGQTSHSVFWLLHAGIAGVGMAILLCFYRAMESALARNTTTEHL
jgi:POT family proton-dependent oligopeptide transporter